MGLLDWGKHVVEGAVSEGKKLAQDGEHAAGTVAEQGADLVGDGLNAVGLHQAAATVDGWGEEAADHLGDQVAEQQLGESTDPTELVHGDVGTLNTTVGHLRSFAAAFGETATGLSAVDTAHWTGDAGEAFRAKFQQHPKQWSDAQQACSDAAGALDSFAQTVTWAQGQAQQAIDLYSQGQQATQRAQAQHQQDVDHYNQAAQTYNAALSAGQNPGPAPTEPAAFTDPGAALRRQAQELLERARAQRDSRAQEAQTAVSAATSLAPQEPSLGHRLLDDASDTLQGAGVAGEHFLGGVVQGTLSLAGFARSLNPLDPYNITHPAEYVDGLSSTAAGLVHSALHPTSLLTSMLGSGWGSDPAEALGNLVPNIALAVGTDGAGTAADAGADLAERAAVNAGEDAGETGARDAAGTAVDNARPPEGMTCQGDPIDVATGAMVLTQTDLHLPGVLPLVLRRTHLSSYRLGRWFGRCWASTLDQRLIVDEHGVLYTAPDGVILFYPLPGVDAPVLPEEGARRPLTRTADGTYTITDPSTGLTSHFTPTAGAVHPITAVTDRNGNRLEFRYDTTGAPTEVRHSGGYHVRITTTDDRITGLAVVGEHETEVLSFAYTDGNLTGITNSSGDPLRFTYDHGGRIVEWRDRNDSWYRYTYDHHGRCVHVEGADGFLTGQFTYDTDNRTTTHTNALGATTRYTLDERHHVVTETDPLGHTTHSGWDRYGNLLSRTDPLGRTTRYTYDQHGNPLTVTRPDGSQALAEYGEHQQPVTTIDPDGAVWRYGYDQRGNRTTVTDPMGGVTRYGHSDRGELVAITDPLGHTTRIDTTPAGLPAAITDPAGRRTTYRWDEFGRLSEETDPACGITRTTWTPEGLPASRTTPDGAIEHWVHDGEGNLVEHTDPLGQTTRYEYTHFDLLAAKSTPDGARLAYGYDAELRLTTVTNQQNLTWHYTHDPAGRIITETDFDGRTLHYTLDPAGQTTQRSNGAGQTTTYRYDTLGNLIEQHVGDEVTTFTYDPAGRLVHATDPDCDLTLTHDPLGRVLAETVNGRTLTNTYDAAGNRTHRRTPSGVETTWDYDPTGHPTTLHTAGRTLAFGYDPAGREVERRLDAAFLLTQTWDPAHRLTSQHLLGGELGDTRTTTHHALRPLQHRAYTYRPDGHLTGVDDQLTGPRQFDLDPLGQITAVHGRHGTEHYRYDPAGNQTHATWPTPEPAPVVGARDYTGTHITRAGHTRYTHDTQGRLVVRTQRRLSGTTATWRFTWDAHDRLTAVTTPDGTHWRYRYDPLGRRITKQRLTPDQATVAEQIDFTWDGDTLAEQTHNGTAHTTWNYQPGTHTPLTQTEHTGPPGQDWYDQRFYAIITDLIGTPTELIDTHGTLAWHQPVTLWGAALDRLANRVTTPLRFPGQYHDPETGLHYNHHRYYDPTTARYTTPDPLGLSSSPNPTTYVPNPTAETDPLGLMACSPRADDLLNNANETYKDTGYTNAGRALQKKLGRPGEQQAFADYAPSKGDPAGYNAAALNALRDMVHSQPTQEVGRVAGVYQTLWAYRLPSGIGARFTLSGTFVGFVA